MEFTVSQIGSAAPHWVARHVPAASGALRRAVTQSVDSVPAMPVAKLADMETEYDEFGRFGATPPDVAEAAGVLQERSPSANATAKYFRSGNVTAHELELEYKRSLVDGAVEDAGATRRFIPAGMTEYQVYQLRDFQYRWMLEVERRALEQERLDALLSAVDRATGPGIDGAENSG